MTWTTIAKVNFRNTSGYVTDGAGQTYCLPSDTYTGSVIRGGLVFGWSATVFGDNLSTSGDVRVAGGNRTTSGSIYWRIDLPATGLYRVMTGSRRGSAGNGRLSLRDGTTEYKLTTGAFTDSTDILDLNSAIQADPATWAANPYTVDHTFTTTELRVYRGSADTLYLSHIEIQRWIEDDLTDVTLQDHFGDAAAAPTMYAGQPEGYRALKILLTSGTIGTSAWVFGGDLGAYFTTQLISGSLWAVCNSTRMPDSLAGSGKTLTIQQTDSAFVTPHTTNFSCTVVSSQARDTTGWLGLITTQNWLNRKTVLTAHAGLWAGYTGQSFNTDVAVTSASELNTALSAIADGRTVWDRIRLQNGTYSGQLTQFLSYGSGGGLLIEPDAGHDPEINVEFTDIRIHGLHWRNTLMPGIGIGLFQFRSQDPGGSGINGTGRFTKMKFTGNRVGYLHKAGQTESDVIAGSSSFMSLDHGESIEIVGNDFNGVSSNILIASGVRLQKFEQNDCKKISGDIYRPSNAAVYGSTQGVFADNHVYCSLRSNRIRAEIDAVDWYNQAHPDTWQIGAFQANIANWAISTIVSFNELRLNMLAGTPAIYRCTTAGTTASSGTGPSGTGTGITDGSAVWEWVANYTTASNLYGIFEQNSMNSRSQNADEGTARQCFLDSNAGKNCPAFMSINNNAFGTESSYGMRPGGGVSELHAEFNTLASASRVTGVQGAQTSSIFCTASGQKIMALHNVVQAATSNSGSGAKTFVQDEVIVSWLSAATAPNRPADKLTGPFSAVGINNRWGYPSLDTNELTGTADAFDSDMRSILKVLTGTAGIYVEPSSNALPVKINQLRQQRIQ